MNEVVIPVGLKDYFNSSKPSADGAALPLVQDPELPHLLNAVYGTEVPDSDPSTPGIQRADLIQVFLTGVPTLNQPAHVKPSEMLRLNTAIAPCTHRLLAPGRASVATPRGSRTDVVCPTTSSTISLRAVLGVLLPDHQALADTIGDGVDANDVPFLGAFPYVAYPASGSDPTPHS